MASAAIRGRLGYVLALLLALLVFIFASAPAWLMARFASSFTDDRVRLEQPTGSFWTGRAEIASLALVDGSRHRLENLSWQVAPGRLLRGEAAIHFVLKDAQVTGQGIVSFAGSQTTISGLHASLPAGLLGALAPTLGVWKPAGTLRIDAAELALNPPQLGKTATLAWSGATLGLFNLPALGNYRLILTPANGNTGLNLQTISGTLLINGTGQYAPKTGGEFRATARAAQGFADQLAPLLRLMGPTNSDGSVNFVLPLESMQ